MSISLVVATEFMITNGYILPLGGGKYKLSTKFLQEFGKAYKPAPRQYALGIDPVSKKTDPVLFQTQPDGTVVVPGKFYFSWENRYKQFIMEAKVPARLDNNRGENYQVNGYSEKGMKAYRKACESGIEHELLVKSTMLYYHSRIRFKVAIGRYMEEGIWKTGYDALADAAGQGEQQVIDHIKAETQDDQQSSYRVG